MLIPISRGTALCLQEKKIKIFPCYSFLTASRKRPVCPGVPGASSAGGSSPRLVLTWLPALWRGAGLSLHRFPVLFVRVCFLFMQMCREKHATEYVACKNRCSWEVF